MPNFRRKQKLTEIDFLINTLAKDKKVLVEAPTGDLWQIELQDRVLLDGKQIRVSFRRKGQTAWHPLNLGWRFSENVDDPLDRARIIIGQILVGTRISGHSLDRLYCGVKISDHNPFPYYARVI